VIYRLLLLLPAPKTNPVEHKEWVRRCVLFRQQIGSRLEVLASLADRQIAQEDEKSGGQRVSPSAAGARQVTTSQNASMAVQGSASQMQQQSTSAASQQAYAPPQVSTMASTNPMAMASMGSAPASTASISAPMAMPNMTSSTPAALFPEPLIPTVGFTSTSSSMFFPTGQVNPMQSSTGFSSTTSMAASGATTTQGYAMTSGAQHFTPNAYMASTSGAPNSSAAYMNQNYMMGGGMMTPQQQFMPMAMPMNLASSGGASMYGNNNYGVASASTAAGSSNAGSGNSSSSSHNFPVDPFMTPLGFGPDASFGATGFPMAGMASMPMQQQQQQMMGPMNGGNFGAQAASMMPNNFGYGMSASQGMMPQFQPTQPFPQQSQLPQQPPQQAAGSMNALPDSALYGDSNVNIFEGLTDDAFFPMQ
jgi:hypothetical protein